MAQQTLQKYDPIVALIFLTALGIFCFHIGKVEAQELASDATAVSEERQAAAVKAATGKITFEEQFFDFGAVVEGDIIKHSFRFKNEGMRPVKIVKTETSCGCTTLSGVIKEYGPGETGEMEVVVDTRDKKGIIVKTVTLMLENSESPKLEISLVMKLTPPPHPRIGSIRNINTEAACKSCHLESGVGETGVFLYHRVCSQCHGKKGVGGFGRALNDTKWQKVDDAYIRKIIHEGLPDRGMPSYVAGVTPPLTEDQVGSLVKYIRSMVKH